MLQSIRQNQEITFDTTLESNPQAAFEFAGMVPMEKEAFWDQGLVVSLLGFWNSFLGFSGLL